MHENSLSSMDAFALDPQGEYVAVRERPRLLKWNANQFPVYLDPKQYFVPPPKAPFGPLWRDRAVQKPYIRRPPPCVFLPSERSYPREMEMVKIYHRGRRSLENCHRVMQEVAAKIPPKVNEFTSKIRDALSIEKYLNPSPEEAEGQAPYIDWENSVIVTPLKNFHGCTAEDYGGPPMDLSPTTTAAGSTTAAFPIGTRFVSEPCQRHNLAVPVPRCTCLPSVTDGATDRTTTNPMQRLHTYSTDPAAVWDSTGAKNPSGLRFAHVKPYINYQEHGKPQLRELPGFTLYTDGNGFFTQADTADAKQATPIYSATSQHLPPPEIDVRPPPDKDSPRSDRQRHSGSTLQPLDFHKRSSSAPVPPLQDLQLPEAPSHAQSSPTDMKYDYRYRTDLKPTTEHSTPQQVLERSACPAFQHCPVHGAQNPVDSERRLIQDYIHPSVQIYPIGERRTKIFSTNKKLMATDDVKHWRRIGQHATFDMAQLPSWCPPPAPPPLNAQFLMRR